MNKSVSRKEDMSPRGQIKVLIDDQGDIHVTVFEDNGNGIIENSASIEFCCCGSGGGKSPNTVRALRDLAEAIKLDNCKTPSRAGDL